MLIRLGLLLLILAFGACCFAAGLFAPDAWRTVFQPLAGKASPSKTSPRPGTSHAIVATASSASPPTSSLLVETTVAQAAPAPGQPAYALQMGQYASAVDADSAQKRGRTELPDMPIRRFDTFDAAHRTWTIVAIGRYPSSDMAHQAAPRLQARLGVADLSVIRLPDDPAPAHAP